MNSQRPPANEKKPSHRAENPSAGTPAAGLPPCQRWWILVSMPV